MKKVLIISYTFPPVGGAGVQRVSKFVKFLRKFGWEPEVITTANPSVPIIDEALVSDIPADIVIHRSKTFEPSYAIKSRIGKSETNKKSIKYKIISSAKNTIKYLLTPDPQILWWPHTSLILFKLLRSRSYDVIFSSGPPFSVLILSVFWGRIFGIPVVSDFRDEWSFSRNNWENAHGNRFFHWLDSRMERWIFKNSTSITVASPFYKNTFLEKFGNQFEDKVSTITNGYDLDDFSHASFSKNVNIEECFEFVYTGTVWKATSLVPFAKALESIFSENPYLKVKIRLKVFGRVVADEEEYLKQSCFRDVISLHGYVDHGEVISEMQLADCLILTLADLPGAEKIIPGKTFEYMVGNAPVLAIIPDGACSSILSELPGFIVVCPGDTEKIKKSILYLLGAEKLDDKLPNKKYERLNLTQDLSKIFDKNIQ